MTEEEIEEIKDKLFPCELYRNELLNPVDRNVKAKVRYRNSFMQTADIVECYFIQQELSVKSESRKTLTGIQ